MSEDFARQWLDAVAGVSIQFTLLAAVSAAALFVARPPAPRVRHAVWLLVLLRLTIPVGLASPFGVVPASLVPPRSTAALSGDTVLTRGLTETSTAVASPESASRTASGESSASTTRPVLAASPAVVIFLAWAPAFSCWRPRSSCRRRAGGYGHATPSPCRPGSNSASTGSAGSSACAGPRMRG